MSSRSWNRVELIGNLTRDPELRYTPQGTAVATFSVATNRTYVSDGEKKEEVDFHRIVAWAKLAELCNQLLKKGNRIFVSGRLQNKSWEGQDGQQKNLTEIVLEDMLLLTNKSEGSSYSIADDVDANLSVSTRAVDEMPKSAPADTSSKEVKTEDKDSSSKDDSDTKKSKPVSEEVGDLDDLPF